MAVLVLRLGEIEVGQPDGVHAAVVEKDRLVRVAAGQTRVSPLLPQVETGRHLLGEKQNRVYTLWGHWTRATAASKVVMVPISR